MVICIVVSPGVPVVDQGPIVLDTVQTHDSCDRYIGTGDYDTFWWHHKQDCWLLGHFVQKCKNTTIRVNMFLGYYVRELGNKANTYALEQLTNGSKQSYCEK